MADASEDALLQAGPAQSSAVDNDAGDDEVQDFRFFATQKLPSRGEKDFEPHGTNLQQNTLDSSRDAMYDAIDQTRYHHPDVQRAIYDPVNGGAWMAKNIGGKWTATVGRSRRDADNVPRLWLLPEEALWMIERGSLEIRWPAELGAGDDGLPMSLQGAYAAFVGFEKDRLTMEMFKVYQHLKRAGYVVLRADENFHNVPAVPVPPSSTFWTTFSLLWKGLLQKSDPPTRLALGPLVKPGLYRSYAQIFSLLTYVQFHDPRTAPRLQPAKNDSKFNVAYHVYKSVTDYKKTAPGPPDFYICVVNARTSCVPTETELDNLLSQTPYHPPDGASNVYKKLKDGYSSVIVAVVDQGIISFNRISEAAFGVEKLWARPARPTGAAGQSKRNFKPKGRR